MTQLEFDELYEKISSMKIKEQTHEFNSLDIDERKDYLKFLENKSKDLYEDFIDDIRRQAINDFWTQERELILEGKCTRDWTPEQIESIMCMSESTGKMSVNGGRAFQINANGEKIVDSKGNTSYYAHHMLDVSTHPEYAGDWRNIQALACGEHYDGAHNGNTKIPTEGYYDYITRETKIFDKWQKANMNWINDSIAIVY